MKGGSMGAREGNFKGGSIYSQTNHSQTGP